jgi:hypothetical protein
LIFEVHLEVSRAHQTRRSGRLLRLGFNEVTQFLSKSEVLVALSVFSSPYFFHQLSYFFFNIPMFLKCDPYRVWCSIFYSKLVNCILLRALFVFVKGRGTCGSGERNLTFWIDFRKSPRFSLTSPLSQEREKSSRPVFTMCGEPWVRMFYCFQRLLNYWLWSYMMKVILETCHAH